MTTDDEKSLEISQVNGGEFDRVWDMTLLLV